MVTDCLPWSEMTAEWIRDAMTIDMPIFGVCYGHQLMAHALGMRSLLSPKRSIVRMPDDSLMPADGASFLPAPGKFAPHLLRPLGNFPTFDEEGPPLSSLVLATLYRAVFTSPSALSALSRKSKRLPQCSLN